MESVWHTQLTSIQLIYIVYVQHRGWLLARISPQFTGVMQPLSVCQRHERTTLAITYYYIIKAIEYLIPAINIITED